MSSPLYKKLKLKLSIILAVLIIIFIVFGIILNYIFSYSSSYEYINIHFTQLYKNIKDSFDKTDFFYTDDKTNKNEYERIKNLIIDFSDGYDITKLYTLKKLNDGSIVYLTYSEKGSDNNETFTGKNVSNEVFKNANKIYSDKENIIYDNPDLFSDEKVIKYMYSITDSKNNIIGILGFEVDISEIQIISNKTFIKSAGTFIVIMLMFSILLSIMFYKFFQRAFVRFVYTDTLTKLKNRTAYEEHITKIDEKIKNSFDHNKEKIYLIAFDLNDLKFVNDTFGHIAGDEYIKSASNIIDKVFSDIGSTYRTGGDEFVTIIIKNISDNIIDEKILKLIEYEKDYNSKDKNYFMSISVGYDSFNAGFDMNLISVLKRADEKMYNDKKLKKLKIKEFKENNKNINV